jgi:hypothetical protein
MPAGYSGTPLIKKLGIREDSKLLVLEAPEEYLSLLETDVSSQICSPGEVPDIIHLFARSKAIFEAEMEKLNRYCLANRAITIWISWYKKSAGMSTDLTETDIRNYALSHGLVDVKVCAVSQTWSGLKLVVPLSKR